tara:strand:+ start:51 stop:176 length:126 start_codon:yes stop_codon:yes gene_type:complete
MTNNLFSALALKIEKEQQHKPQFTKWRKNKGQFKRKKGKKG